MDLFSDFATQDAQDMDGCFGHVSRAYGNVKCLDDALHAFLSVANARLSPIPKSSQFEIMSKYSRALGSLQEAINSELWRRPEVLCSTQLLALVEVSRRGP